MEYKEIKNKTDNELKMMAMDLAKQYVKEIIEAKQDPTLAVTGEVQKIYDEILDWNWLDVLPIENSENTGIYVRMIAMTQYRHMKYLKEHPPKPQRSKWEVVTGVVKKEEETD
mgnify:CR=1 FL=1